MCTFLFEEKQQWKRISSFNRVRVLAHIFRANFLSPWLVTTSEGLFANVSVSSLVSRAGRGWRGCQGDQKIGEVRPVE